MSLLVMAGATMLVAAGMLGACSPPRVPEDFGSVPEATAGNVHATATSGSRPTRSSASSTRRHVAVRRSSRAAVVVPAGKIAPVQVALPGRRGAPVVPEDVLDGELTVPDAVGTLGWWVGSAGMESSAGSVVVAGHVDSASQGLGYLAKLRDVAAGDRIVVTGSDGSQRTYTVTGRRTYVKDQGLPEAVFSQSVQPRLVLITCTGAFDRTTGRYEDNLVVYAIPVS